ncbi:MAG TPA: chromate resistance protein ChrB domain-containing protein, partial [Terriglobales bacterium]|nr:chromate resistance protein ChrB domain-containing protein [Terriglobales bacterium]
LKALARIRRRLGELYEIDFFSNPLRSRLETLLAQAEESNAAEPQRAGDIKKMSFQEKVWMTRTRPGIDRVSSAWLIREFIDKKAKFLFDNDPSRHPSAVPFDMFQTAKGFGHRGEDCTFETLCKEFAIRDRRVRVIAQIIHDADLEDDKFGRQEGIGLDRILIGWAKQGVSDEELLRRGMEMIEGLYDSMA